MDHQQRLSSRALLAAALLAAVALAPVTALAQDDVSVSLAAQGAGEAMNNLTVTVSGEMARMDVGEQVSMVWSPDWWRSIMHENRMYIEFDKAMLEQMRQMMGNMPPPPEVQAQADEFDSANMTFERTGATDTVMEYEVFEVAFSDDEGKKGSMWMSPEAEIGMFEIWSKIMPRLQSLAGPMMGGNNPSDELQRYIQLARAQGMPDGKVLRMTVEDGASFEVTGWTWGPFGDDFWEAPAGYNKQAMPAFPR